MCWIGLWLICGCKKFRLYSTSISKYVVGKHAAWKYIEQHYDTLASKYKKTIMALVVTKFQSESQASELETFLKTKTQSCSPEKYKKHWNKFV